MPHRRRLIALISLVSILGIAEASLRLVWGFGTPLLYQWDADLEYRMVPNQSVIRFGKRIETNSFGLRGREFPPTRSSPDELRVLVLGDSVVNGGSHVDESELGTERLERALSTDLGRPVLVMNAAANSWGPPNELAFVRTVGTLDADVAILVLSSHDLVDVPINTATARARPGETYNRPWCALSEVAGLAWARLVPSATPEPPSETDPQRAAESLDALRELLAALRDRVPHVAVALHWDRDEQSAGEPRAALRTLRDEAERAGITVWDLGTSFREVSSRGGEPVMHDRIHPSARGQAVLAETLHARLRASGWLVPAR